MEKKHTVKRIIRIIALIFLIPSACCISWIVSFMVGLQVFEHSAKSLEPPQYPNSTLISEYNSGASCCLWVDKRYYTDDEINAVIVFMEPELRKFGIHQRENSACYYGSRNKSTLTTNFFGIVTLSGMLPYANISICPSKENNGASIWIRLGWPSP